MVRRHTYWQSKRVYWVGEPRCRVKNCSAMWLSILGFMVMGLGSQVVSGQSFWLRIPLRENLHLQNFIIPSVLFPLRLYSSTFFLGCLDKAPYTHLPKKNKCISGGWQSKIKMLGRKVSFEVSFLDLWAAIIWLCAHMIDSLMQVGKEKEGDNVLWSSGGMKVKVTQSCPTLSPDQNTGVGSLFLLQQIFLTQELNWGLLHCRWILYQLSYQGSPYNVLILSNQVRTFMPSFNLNCFLRGPISTCKHIGVRN